MHKRTNTKQIDTLIHTLLQRQNLIYYGTGGPAWLQHLRAEFGQPEHDQRDAHRPAEPHSAAMHFAAGGH